MGLWDGDSSTHSPNHIHGQLTMIPVFLLVSLSVFIFHSAPSFSTFKSLCCVCGTHPSFHCSSCTGKFLHSFAILPDCRSYRLTSEIGWTMVAHTGLCILLRSWGRSQNVTVLALWMFYSIQIQSRPGDTSGFRVG